MDPVPPHATLEESHYFALNSSILSGMFEDVNIYTFSRRLGASGRVGHLRFLFANSAMLKQAMSTNEPSASSILGACCLTYTNGFCVVGTVVDEGESLLQQLPPGGYDYPEDSDLEDCDSEDEAEECGADESLSAQAKRAKSGNSADHAEADKTSGRPAGQEETPASAVDKHDYSEMPTESAASGSTVRPLDVYPLNFGSLFNLTGNGSFPAVRIICIDLQLWSTSARSADANTIRAAISGTSTAVYGPDGRYRFPNVS